MPVLATNGRACRRRVVRARRPHSVFEHPRGSTSRSAPPHHLHPSLDPATVNPRVTIGFDEITQRIGSLAGLDHGREDLDFEFDPVPLAYPTDKLQLSRDDLHHPIRPVTLPLSWGAHAAENDDVLGFGRCGLPRDRVDDGIQ